MQVQKFPFIELTGDAEERGFSHGQQLKEKIKETIKFYKKIFKIDEEEILESAGYFRDIIKEANNDYIIEIKSIARGAEVDERWILALNCRSEILTMVNQEISECTAIVNPNTGLLAQNWDWAEDLEDLAVIMKITYDNGHQILMMTEPGIIGKIGLNSKGIGVTLNFLHAPGKLDGLPIHVMLRLLLDSQNYDEAITNARKFAKGKAGNIIIANAAKYTDFEFANTEHYEFSSDQFDLPFTHTNHYLENDELNRARELLASSMARYARSREIIEAGVDLNSVQDLIHFLKDNKNDELPICRPYVLDIEIGNVGTVCGIVMDLNELIMHYTPGNPFDNNYVQAKL